MINQQSTLFDITEKYPETIPVFVSNGFPQMEDAAKRTTIGKSITLNAAVSMKKMDLDSFIRLLEEAISRSSDDTDITLNQDKLKPVNSDGLNVVGILPCPVRIPLMEKWNAYLNSRKESGKAEVNHELKAASMGLDWVQKNIDGVEDPDKLPDLFMSAGFDMFFDKQRFGRFRREGVFTDLTDIEQYNVDFSDLDIKDPQGLYSIISVVPSLFLVNTEELGDREAPRSWEDLLDPKFENSVSLPVSDFDLFNAILLNIHKKYGDNGVQALGRSLLESMHPAQMVRSDEQPKQNKPAVTIMPYFFSKMVKEGGPLQAVWPEDGSIISPIFMLAKSAKAQELKEIVDFFASEEVGNLLAVQGLFPSTNPNVSNVLPENSPFMWLGWDYIEQHDLSQLITHCEGLFNGATQGAQKTCSGGCCS
ncbi:ABC transporter substrate-binding protein [Vibrio sp. JC009]|uniref:ABC transporter substrate-binding protein n=1 Tax=Vibrio sp. JC009 TaxID=2912314 RepID=UPI0023AFC685|nr:ABC transporter substrate-binding protein [Vibrio sp. JC009]WED23932.1 ABC transporter substrate-binding protein [Vibrio sp. JC009]